MEYKLQWKPKPGQLLLYIDFSAIKQRSIEATLQILKELSYEPELRYSEREGQVKLYALLKDEQHDPSVPIPEEYMEEELGALYERLVPDDLAIRCARGLPQTNLVTVASHPL